jgi:hypothetical protein
MKKYLFYDILVLSMAVFIFSAITALTSFVSFVPDAEARGVKTSYKRYSIFNYKNEEILCEPYVVNKGDWLYKIFRKKGEISDKDFPRFLIIFKQINPQINNIDAILPGVTILIPLQKVLEGDYNQTSPGNVEVSVIEFSKSQEDFSLKLQAFGKKHTVQKGESVSTLIDKDFLIKGGDISKEGLKAFKLANPNVTNINIVYAGTDIYLPDPDVRSQPWFKDLMSGQNSNNSPKGAVDPATKERSETSAPGARPELRAKQVKIQAHKLVQLQRYSSLIGGTLLGSGKMYFPGENNSIHALDLGSTPLIEFPSGEKILILSGGNVNEELLEHIKAYWKGLKTQLISDSLNKLTGLDRDKRKTPEDLPSAPNNQISSHKKMIAALLSQTDYDYISDAKISFILNNLQLEAVFGRMIREDKVDILFNFGNVYGAALDVLKKREFKILSITPELSQEDIVKMIFSSLGYNIMANPSFFTGKKVESINGIYASKGDNKLFISMNSLNMAARDYLNREEITILSIVK